MDGNMKIWHKIQAEKCEKWLFVLKGYKNKLFCTEKMDFDGQK